MNSLKNSLLDSFSAHENLVKRVLSDCGDEIILAAKTLSDVLSKGGTIFWCGNGGSAADSQHLAAELVGRFKKNRKALRSLALTTDSSVLTCVANDFSYAEIFSRQLDALARKGDVLIAISTSGHSENINTALKKANSLELTTISLLGKGGGKAKSFSDLSITIPSESTARIQEMHIFIGHVLCELIELQLGFN